MNSVFDQQGEGWLPGTSQANQALDAAARKMGYPNAAAAQAAGKTLPTNANDVSKFWGQSQAATPQSAPQPSRQTASAPRQNALPPSGSSIPGKPGAVADGRGGWSYPGGPQPSQKMPTSAPASMPQTGAQAATQPTPQSAAQPAQGKLPPHLDPAPNRTDGVYQYWKSTLGKLVPLDSSGMPKIPTPPPLPPPGVDERVWTNLYIQSHKGTIKFEDSDDDATKKNKWAQQVYSKISALEQMLKMLPKNSPWRKILTYDLKGEQRLAYNIKMQPIWNAQIRAKQAQSQNANNQAKPARPPQQPIPRISTPAPKPQSTTQSQDPGFVNLPAPRISSTPAPSSSSGIQFRVIDDILRPIGAPPSTNEPEPANSGMR